MTVWFNALTIGITWAISIAVVQTRPEVEFLGIWGTLTINADNIFEKETVTCSVNSKAAEGEFVWIIGDETLVNSNEVKSLGKGKYQQAFSILPYIKYDQKKIRCKYIERDSSGGVVSEAEDSLKLNINFIGLPLKTNLGYYDPSGPIELELEFKVYPKPDNDQIYWTIRNMSVDTEEKLPIGTLMGRYEVMALEALAEPTYRSILKISNINENDEKNSYALVVEHLGNKHSIPVTFSLQRDMESGSLGFPYVLTNDSSTEKPIVKNSETQLGIGLMIVLGIVVLILLVCIGYCIYENCHKKQSQTVNNSQKGAYASVSSR
eukprot:maker-scaffold630_size122347-snap-gene-0.15 protein:Tk08031 transcript:maker-scaffold630_size122347-snap-gene-0.15-mRNA-1 annotation:"predicted protein"